MNTYTYNITFFLTNLSYFFYQYKAYIDTRDLCENDNRHTTLSTPRICWVKTIVHRREIHENNNATKIPEPILPNIHRGAQICSGMAGLKLAIDCTEGLPPRVSGNTPQSVCDDALENSPNLVVFFNLARWLKDKGAKRNISTWGRPSFFLAFRVCRERF